MTHVYIEEAANANGSTPTTMMAVESTDQSSTNEVKLFQVTVAADVQLRLTGCMNVYATDEDQAEGKVQAQIDNGTLGLEMEDDEFGCTQEKFLVLVAKPVYMGFYVAVNALSKQDAVDKVKDQLNNEGPFEEKVTEMFGDMRVTAHGEVREEFGGFVNSANDGWGYDIATDYHGELDMDAVVAPADLAATARYMSTDVDSLPALDLDNAGFETEMQIKVNTVCEKATS